MNLTVELFARLRGKVRGSISGEHRSPVARLAMVLGLAVLPSLSLAQTTPAYEITRYTIDNGGGHSVSGAYELNGTIGQPDASQVLEAGGFQLTGGFWRRAPTGTLGPLIFRDGFEGVAP